MTIARKFKHPETGETLTAKEWAEKIGIDTSTFYSLVRKHGEDSLLCYEVNTESYNGSPTQEWLDLCKRRNKPKDFGFEAGTWEREHIKEPDLKKAKRSVIYRRGPLPYTSIAKMERPVYEAFKELGEARPVEVANHLGKEPKWVGKKASRLAEKGYLIKIKRGIYAVSTTRD